MGLQVSSIVIIQQSENKVRLEFEWFSEHWISHSHQDRPQTVMNVTVNHPHQHLVSYQLAKLVFMFEVKQVDSLNLNLKQGHLKALSTGGLKGSYVE